LTTDIACLYDSPASCCVAVCIESKHISGYVGVFRKKFVQYGLKPNVKTYEFQ